MAIFVDRPESFSSGHIYYLGTDSYARFRQHSSSSFGGDALTVKIKDGCHLPYLSTDWNHFWACTTRPLGEHLREVSKKSNQWSWRRCNNEIVTMLSIEQKIVTMLSIGQIAILKMAVVRQYLLTDRNRFKVDTTRHWKEFISKVLAKFLKLFQRRCDNGENRSWLPAAIFVNGPECIRADTTRPLREQLWQVSKKFWPVVSSEMR